MTSYYTPSLDEFHVGIEYESFEKDNWCKRVFEFSDRFDVLKTRFKYLTTEDIVELGFRFQNHSEDGEVYIKPVSSIMGIDYIELIYSKHADEPFIQINASDGYPILTDINIKNKYELKWLLSRYGLVGDDIR